MNRYAIHMCLSYAAPKSLYDLITMIKHRNHFSISLFLSHYHKSHFQISLHYNRLIWHKQAYARISKSKQLQLIPSVRISMWMLWNAMKLWLLQQIIDRISNHKSHLNGDPVVNKIVDDCRIQVPWRPGRPNDITPCLLQVKSIKISWAR